MTANKPSPTRRLAAAATGLALALSVALTGCGAQAAGTAEAAHTITVSSSASVQAVPDVARITVVIETTGATASAAQKANGKPTKAVLACLEDAGVPKEHVQTSYTDLSPTWNDEDGMEDGYEMRTVLDVSELPIEGLNTLMEAIVDAGATEVNGPDYYVSSYDELYEQALSDAVAAAKPKAESIASASGAALGNIVSVTEGYQDTSLRLKGMGVASEEANAMDGGLAPIEPGEVSVSAEITVTFALK